ncbi:uncharacterized protein [Drosophila virilis]|uniref:BACK domain-containing protein n=1 Tax=Drosophila virilis TaxID=7244 RepID=B4MEN9_DROVI|nr:uncharacterized protein LOC6636061 [Drosophila virilis]XP_032295506.1 uncharacterized protein LOC6636061 [Drosophila virilis]EDW63014.1 uncharacterized protein Dvir_GJ14737 [Drosophila virilis]
MDLKHAKNAKKELEQNDAKEIVWTPIRALREEWKTSIETKNSRKDQHDRIVQFISHQRELGAGDSDAEDEQEQNVDEINEQERINDEKEAQRQQLIADGIKEQQRMRQAKWEKDMQNELHLLNDLKREQVYDHKLKNPIPITECHTSVHKCDESLATMSDLNKLVAQRVPKIMLDELLTEPLLSWESKMLPKKPDLVEALCHLFRQNIGPTLAVVVEGKQLYCHSMLLGLTSAFFNDRNFSQVLYLPASKIASRSFVNIYRWMLEPINSITLTQLVELMRASQFLAIEELSKQCWRLAHDVLKTTDRVLTMYIVSQRVCVNIEKIITPYVGRVWMSYAASREFTNLEFSKVRRLLQLDNLSVNTEMEVLYTAILWLDGDWPLRQRYAVDLMRVIRFDVMPFVFLIGFDRRKDGPPAMKYLRESVKVRKFIFDGLADLRLKPDRHVGGNGSCPRDWIYDPSCPYHHGHTCNTVRYATFNEFINYLQWVQRSGNLSVNRIKRYTDNDIVCC